MSNPVPQPIELPEWLREMFKPRPHTPFFPPDAPKDWPGPGKEKQKEPA